jgi:hypothetical protein
VLSLAIAGENHLCFTSKFAMAGANKALLGAKLRLAAYMSSSKVVVPRRAMGAAAAHGHGDHHHHVVREIVGYGLNGEEVYIDDVHAPFPAIRFKEDTAEISVSLRFKRSTL